MRIHTLSLLAVLAATSAVAQTNSIQLRNGANTTTLFAPAGGNYTLTLPASAGTNGQALTTNGSGTLSWGAVASSIDGLSDAKSGGTDFSNSLILGHQATGTLSAASNNTAVGYGSLQAITSGDDNTALGYNALYAVQDGWGLTAIGSGALQAAGSATRTVAIGYQAGYNVTNSGYSVFIGYESGKSYSTTGAAVGVGYRALYNATGAHNIGLGIETLLATSGGNNVAVGNYAGGNITTGTNNVALGYGAAAKIVAGSGNVILGYAAGPTANASNRLYIDNTETDAPLIYGDFSGNTLTFNGETTTTGTSAINGVVSIGGTTAAAGEIRLLEDLDDGSHYTAFKAQAQAANVTYILPASDGTTGYLLSTNGSGTLSWTNSLVATTRFAKTNASSGGEFYIEDSGGNPDWVFDQEGDGSNPRLRIFNNLETNGIAIEDAGNVGIGIGDPTEKLHVSGNIRATGSVYAGQVKRNYRNDVTGGTHLVQDTDSWIVVNRAGSTTITLPDPTLAANLYRELMFKTVQAQTVISASSNVVPLNGDAAGTAILPGVDGAWATLVCDGTNWVIMQSGQ